MANKNAEKKTAAVVCALKEDSHLPRPQSKKDNQQDSKKDIKKDSQKNNIAAADRHKDSNHSFLFLLLFLTVLFFSVYYYISPNFFKEEIKQPSPSPELVNDKMSEQERKEKEKEVQRLNEDLSKSISDQVQETLKKFDDKESQGEFQESLLYLKESSTKKNGGESKKVLLNFEKEKKSYQENLETKAKSLQSKLEIDLENFPITEEKLDIFKREANILCENCRKDLAILIKKADTDYDKLIDKIKKAVEIIKAEIVKKEKENKDKDKNVKFISHIMDDYYDDVDMETFTKLMWDKFLEDIQTFLSFYGAFFYIFGLIVMFFMIFQGARRWCEETFGLDCSVLSDHDESELNDLYESFLNSNREQEMQEMRIVDINNEVQE